MRVLIRLYLILIVGSVAVGCQSDGKREPAQESRPVPLGTWTPRPTVVLPPTWTSVPKVFAQPTAYRAVWPTARPRPGVAAAAEATPSPTPASTVIVLNESGLELVAWEKQGRRYGNVGSAYQSTELWDLTTCDLTLAYTLDLPQRGEALVGLMGGASGWMWARSLKETDTLFLAAAGGDDESRYDVLPPDILVTAPIGNPALSYGLQFERGAPAAPAGWGKIDGVTVNTGGIYHITITFHAIDRSIGTMFATVNGVQAGFYDSARDGAPDHSPVGRSFSGDDLGRVRIFASAIGALVQDVTVEGCPTILYAAVDIGPGSKCISNSSDTIPVIIFGDTSLDVSQINPHTLRLGSLSVNLVGGVPAAYAAYLNDDPYPDLEVQFSNPQQGLTLDQPVAVVTGQLKNFEPFEGTEAICVVK